MTEQNTAKPLHKPQSATHPLTGLAGMAALIFGIWLFKDIRTQPLISGLCILGGMAAVMITLEVLIFRTFARASTGLDWSRKNWNPLRAVIKLCGLMLTIALLAGLYAFFPFYERAMFVPVWDAILLIWPYFAVMAVVYIFVVDAVMVKPEDGYYQMGLIATLNWKRVDRAFLLPHARSWIIKGFFTPLMFVYVLENFTSINGHLHNGNWMHDVLALFWFGWVALLVLDLSFTVIGYVFAFRVLDTHERSSEPTMLGWVVAIMCYQPFWAMINENYLNYGGNYKWESLYASAPIFVGLWAGCAFALMFIYSWSTVAFGLRFSNLTHRGIITSGPYAWTKHPAYISKNLSWWMLAAPFLSRTGDPLDAIGPCFALLVVNFVYYLRAKTEERHLGRDPVYREYAAWIERHGIFRWVPRI